MLAVFRLLSAIAYKEGRSLGKPDCGQFRARCLSTVQMARLCCLTKTHHPGEISSLDLDCESEHGNTCHRRTRRCVANAGALEATHMHKSHSLSEPGRGLLVYSYFRFHDNHPSPDFSIQEQRYNLETPHGACRFMSSSYIALKEEIYHFSDA